LATAGPHLVVNEAFADIPRIDRLVIFGSWAARYHTVNGPPPNDLDVLVVGKPDLTAIYAAADVIERRTGLPVNPVIASVTRWNDNSDPLIAQIKSSPVVDVALAPSAASSG